MRFRQRHLPARCCEAGTGRGKHAAEGLIDGVDFTHELLDPAEMRRQLESALDARAEHDSLDGQPGLDAGLSADDPVFWMKATWLRCRLDAFPAPTLAPLCEGE